MRPSRAPAAPRDPYPFIDLARSGRTDWWSAAKGLLEIVFCYVLLSIAAVAAIIWWREVLPAGGVDVLVRVVVAASWALGLRGARARETQKVAIAERPATAATSSPAS
jgi:hypothetical protein